MPPRVRGDSPQCGEMSRSDKGDGRRQRVASASFDGGVVRKKDKVLKSVFLSPSVSLHSTPLGCRLGRRFCFAEVSTGHPRPRQREAFKASAVFLPPLVRESLWCSSDLSLPLSGEVSSVNETEG